MSRRKKKSAAITTADPKARPPAPTLPDQNPDQIVAHFRVTDVGNARSLTVDARMPESFSRLMATFGTKDRDFFWGFTTQITNVKSRNNACEATNFLLSVLKTKQPRDELEAMLLAQMRLVDEDRHRTDRRRSSALAEDPSVAEHCRSGYRQI